MKRVLALLVLVMVCLSYTISNAENKEDLTFQGISWFSSPKNTIQRLIDLGFIDKTKDKIYDRYIKNIADNDNQFKESKIYTDESDKNCPYTTASGSAPLSEKLKNITFADNYIKKTIAKNEITWLNFSYAILDGNPKLVECYISFQGKSPDNDAIFNALVSAYGEPTAIKENDESIWMGANNTIILLGRNKIVFATLDGLIQANEHQVPASEKEDTGF